MELIDVALIFICTGGKYRKFLQNAIDGAKKFFPANILLFTDSDDEYDVAKQVKIPSLSWPEVTLKRYHLFVSEKEWLSQFKYVLYLDLDMKICKPIGYEIFGDITVAIHSGFVNWHGYPEENPKSTAYLPTSKVKTYVSGAVQGGKVSDFLEMSEILKENIDTDLANNFMAKWYDESHLNHYVANHQKKVKVLPATFHLYEQVDSIICRINKGWQLPESHDGERDKFDPDVEKLLGSLHV